MRTFKVGDPIHIGSARGEVNSIGVNDGAVCIYWSDGSANWFAPKTLSAMLTQPNTTTDVIGDVQVTVHEPALSAEVVNLARELYIKHDNAEIEDCLFDAINFYNAVKNYKPCGTEPKK